MSLVDDTLKAELSTLYSAPDRHYHDLSHVNALLALAGEHRAALADPEAVEAAIWFHDAIYDTARKDNEARSAELAAERLTGKVEPVRLQRIVRMIEATATHQMPDFADETACRDAALFLDLDLSIRRVRASGQAGVCLGGRSRVACRARGGAEELPRAAAYFPHRNLSPQP
jgi:predicted metal-dependent HD superfamily phosphohydrolase